MNVENIKRVRDVIAALPPERLDMASLFSKAGEESLDSRRMHATAVKGCNTAACIAGWTLATLRPRDRDGGMREAGDLLGLNGFVSYDLFLPRGYSDPGRYTPAHAVKVLDHLLETGEVDWVAAQGAAQ